MVVAPPTAAAIAFASANRSPSGASVIAAVTAGERRDAVSSNV